MGRLKPGWEGRFFEDFEIGDVYRCRYGRTVTEADNIQFTLLTSNTNQIHFNTDYAARTEWGRCLVNSALTLSIVAGMGVADVSENGFALGWDEIALPSPVFAGDTLYSESEVIEVRESASRPAQGIVKVETRGYKQDGTLVIRYRRSVMVWKRAHAPSIALFPRANDAASS
jgi:itaconyl-CoA hydratase